jgi:mono/diheme cytochrome c family protein
VAEHAVQCDENLPHALCGTQRTASNRSGRKVDDHQHFVPEAAEAEALHQTPFLGFGFEPQEAQRLPVLAYIMVDHHFANASQGAIGLVSTETKPPAAKLEHHNMAAVDATPTDPAAARGKLAFESKCLACHSMGQGKKLGPDLAGVSKLRSAEWLTRWMKEPEKMLQTDATAKAMLKEYNNIPMPNQNLTDAEVREYLKYFQWYDAQPAGSVKKAAAH